MTVEVQSGEGDKIQIDYYARRKNDLEGIVLTNQSETLSLYEEQKDLFHWYLFMIPRKVVITIPSDQVCGYELEVHSGEVYLRGVKPENVAVNLSSGYIEADFDQSVHSGELRAEIASGKLTGKGAFENQSFRIHSGKAVWNNFIQPAQIKAVVESGSLNIGVPEPEQLAITGHVSSGSVRNDYTGIKFENENPEQQTGNVPVVVDVSSGSIILQACPRAVAGKAKVGSVKFDCHPGLDDKSGDEYLSG